MIAEICGTVKEVGENSIILQVNHIAYEILVPGSVISAYRKKQKNSGDQKEPDTFFTIQYIEGSSGHGNQFFRLVGFKRKIEKDFFQLYTSVEGIGYKTALKSLIFPIQKIATAIEMNDLATLKKLPHIGKRTAEKMVATLKGRMQKFALDQEAQPLTVFPEEDFHSEVLQVLKQVGYSESESMRLMEKAIQANSKVKNAEELIHEIFRIQNTPESGSAGKK